MRKIRPFEPKDQEYTIVDNVIFDYIMPSLSPNAWKVLCLILRKTRGWHKEWDGLAYSQIKEGTGIKSDPTVNKALNELLDKEFIRQTKGAKWDAAQYALNTTIEIEVENGSTIENEVDATIENKVEPTIESKDTKQTMKQTKKQKKRGTAEKTPPAPAPSRDYLTDLFNGNTQDDGLREGEKLIQIADWDIRSPEHRQAMAAFLEASRLPVPPDKTRKDWIKSIDTHVQTYGATELENMYPCIIAQMRGDNLTVSRPGSVTNNLADYWAKERNGGNNARSSERHTEHQKRIAEAFRSTARNPGD